MRINVHIERLIVDGLSVKTSRGSLVQLALAQELTSLLVANGIAAELIAGGWVSHLPATMIQVPWSAPPARLGQQIARAVHSRIGGEPRHGQST